MHRFFWPLTIFIFFSACTDKKTSSKKIITIDKAWLDSIKHKSDTSWTKPYRNNEFVTSEYYINKKDSIVTQLMKDSAGTIRQVSIAKYDRLRLFFAEYYSNGQIKATLPLDSNGKYNGPGKYYYENGHIKSEGTFIHGLYIDQWKNFDEQGKPLSIDEYDSNGQLLKTTRQN